MGASPKLENWLPSLAFPLHANDYLCVSFRINGTIGHSQGGLDHMVASGLLRVVNLIRV